MRRKAGKYMAWGRGRRNKILGRKMTVCAAVCTAFLGCIPAQAKEEFSLSYEKPAEGDAYVLYQTKEEEYVVKAGDCLWKIAAYLWGDGRLYMDLYESNRDMIANPDLICPGQRLRTTRPLYLEKLKKPDGLIGIKSGSYQFDTPFGCTVGVLGSDSGANLVLFGNEAKYDIACLIREKEKALDGSGDYEVWEKAVRDYAEKNYGSIVRDLRFEQYLSEQGEPVWLYSYTHVFDLSKYDMSDSMEIQVCAGLKQSGHMQAEFVGFAGGETEIGNQVRYVTASFEDILPEGAECRVNEENMQIYPSVAWEPASFNAIAWVDSYFDDLFMKITGYGEKQKDRKEKLLDKLREGAGMYGGKKETGN